VSATGEVGSSSLGACQCTQHFIGDHRHQQKGKSLVEYLVTSNLEILNGGNKHIFVITNSKEVIDL